MPHAQCAQLHARASRVGEADVASNQAAKLTAGWTLRRERLRLRTQRDAAAALGSTEHSAAKGFDAADLGQGKKDAGGGTYKRNRMAFSCVGGRGNRKQLALHLAHVGRTNGSQARRRVGAHAQG